MFLFYLSKCRTAFFDCRIYRIFLAVGVVLIHIERIQSQEVGAYKTISSGDFPNPLIWAVWNGSTWNPATVKPGSSNDIYIDQTHTLRLTGNEQVKSLFINAETFAGQKLNLNSFNLDVFGMMKAFAGAAPGVPGNAWNSQNWIGNSLQSTITFKGTSRIILEKSSWSAQTTQSRFGVIFDPGSGVELRLEAPLKALSFRLKSGILIQKSDFSSLPVTCFSLSFNNETTAFGSGAFGDFTIESGATFLSECNSGILNRSASGSISALNFELQNGATLILEGSSPRIEAANFQLDGTVVFRGSSGPKSFLSSSFPDAATPNTLKNIELNSGQNLSLPSQLFLSGNLIKTGSGNFQGSTTHLSLTGNENQEIRGFHLVIQDLTLNKSGGIFYTGETLTVERTLLLNQGRIDLQGNNLNINTTLTGGLITKGGSWRNVGTLQIFGLPPTLTAENSSFPFEDIKNGGIRKIQLLGSCPGGAISIRFLEFAGADHDPEFFDTDGTPILYQLLSYFQISGLSPGTHDVELRISAKGLIVNQADDLRIVKTGQSAPGIHLPGLDATYLWARRKLTWNELSDSRFTVGSYRELSPLPVNWIGVSASSAQKGNLVSWEVGLEKDNLLFEVYRSKVDKLDWEKISSVGSQGDSTKPRVYSILDQEASKFETYIYRIRQISLDGTESWSSAAKTINQQSDFPKDAIIYPNPYHYGPLKIYIPDWNSTGRIYLKNSQGQLILEHELTKEIPEEVLSSLPAGVYFMMIRSGERQYSKKLVNDQ